MNQKANSVLPITVRVSGLFEHARHHVENEKQKELAMQEEKSATAKQLLKNCIPKIIEAANNVISNGKGELGDNADNAKFVEYQLQLGKLDNMRISKVGMLCILGKAVQEFKKAGWENFAVSFTASQLDHSHDRRIYGDALNFFTVRIRFYETPISYDGISVIDYGDPDRHCGSYHSSRGIVSPDPNQLKGYYSLQEIPEIDSLGYKQLTSNRGAE